MRLILFEVKEEPCTKSIHGWNGKPRIDTYHQNKRLTVLQMIGDQQPLPLPSHTCCKKQRLNNVSHMYLTIQLSEIRGLRFWRNVFRHNFLKIHTPV